MTKEDKAILRNCELVARGIAATFGKYCEVVLHTLEDLDHSVIAIQNSHVTGRTVGSPMTDFALSLLERSKSSNEDVEDNYSSRTPDGKRLKSTTMLVRNASGTPIGMLCINLDVSAPVEEFLQSLFTLKHRPARATVEEHYPHSVRDLVGTRLRVAVTTISQKSGLSTTERNKAVVEDLYRRGIFNVKSAIDIVAEDLGVSRYTIYNYIRDIKNRRAPSTSGASPRLQ